MGGASTFRRSENRGFKGNGSLQSVREREVEDAILQRGYRALFIVGNGGLPW